MASLTVNIAGQWTSTVNVAAAGAVALGINQDGWDLNWRLMGKTLRRTDKFGDSQIERFFSGIDIGISAVFHEWKSQELKFLTVVNQTLTASGVQTYKHGLVGREATASGGVLVLSSVSGTPANSNSFSTITFHSVTVDEDFQLGWNLGPDKAVWPFRGVVWPVDDGSSGAKYFTTA
jgi:hypothetical protein